MALTSGAVIAQYTILAPLGAGGMGEVYRARDARLQREVALKVLPAAVSGDPDRRARFEREAQVLAALNDPHIGAIYGLVEEAGITALVLELVEGPTLADRVAAGAIPVDEALPMARQIAGALAAAHDAGIVHRDLKPANIKLRPDGSVKVLDFGLAKALGPYVGPNFSSAATDATAMAGLKSSPTYAATGAGMILGTAAYMAPEQARGRPVDKRADLWAFGVVLWEMLTGRRLFAGETISDTLVAVLTREPDWSQLPPATPANVVRVLRRCLERDPLQRIRDAGDVRIELSHMDAVPGSPPARARGAMSRMAIAGWGLSAVLGATLVGVWLMQRPVTVTSAAPLTFVAQVSAGHPLASRLGANVLISPDGRTLVYGTTGSSPADAGARRLMVQGLDGSAPTALAGVDNAVSPFFSPDGQWIGFFSAESLVRVGLRGGAPVRVVGSIVGGARGGTWGRDGSIVYAPGFASGLWRVSADGGTPAEVTKLDVARDERSHRWPSFLPCGCAVLFMTQRVGEDYDNADIEVVSLTDGKRTVLVRGGAYPRYAPGGWLLYTRQNTLYATKFDPANLAVGREPARPVIGDLLTWAGDQESGDGSAEYAVADTGTLVYRTSDAQPVDTGSTFVWVDATGQVTPAFTETFRALSLEIAPDGRTIAIDGRSESGLGIWLRDLDRGSVAPLSSARGGETQSAWSPDGRSLAYAVRPSGTARTVRIRPMVGGGAERSIPSAHLASGPTAWSRDGRTLFVDDHDEATRDDVWAIDLTGGSGARPVLRAPGAQAGARVSPDGRWLLYFSDESGTQHVYVQPIDAARPRWQVSTDRGTQPRWSRDGHRIYYVRGAPPDVPSSAVPEAGRILAVDVTEQAGGLRFSTPREIYRGSPLMGAPERPIYDVHPDGRLLVIRRQSRELPADTTHAVVALGWTTSLESASHQP